MRSGGEGTTKGHVNAERTPARGPHDYAEVVALAFTERPQVAADPR
jgi:hypothetical protein